MAIETITIRTATECGAKERQVEADRVGELAAHPMIYPSGLFGVTHLGSGFLAGSCFPSIGAAQNYMEFCQKFDWSFTASEEKTGDKFFPPEQIAALKEACEKFGGCLTQPRWHYLVDAE